MESQITSVNIRVDIVELSDKHHVIIERLLDVNHLSGQNVTVMCCHKCSNMSTINNTRLLMMFIAYKQNLSVLLHHNWYQLMALTIIKTWINVPGAYNESLFAHDYIKSKSVRAVDS